MSNVEDNGTAVAQPEYDDSGSGSEQEEGALSYPWAVWADAGKRAQVRGGRAATGAHLSDKGRTEPAPAEKRTLTAAQQEYRPELLYCLTTPAAIAKGCRLPSQGREDEHTMVLPAGEFPAMEQPELDGGGRWTIKFQLASRGSPNADALRAKPLWQADQAWVALCEAVTGARRGSVVDGTVMLLSAVRKPWFVRLAAWVSASAAPGGECAAAVQEALQAALKAALGDESENMRYEFEWHDRKEQPWRAKPAATVVASGASSAQRRGQNTGRGSRRRY